MAQKRMMNVIRTDTIENKIAWYMATGDYNTAQTWRNVAKVCGAPISEELIEDERLKVMKYRDPTAPV